MPVPKCLFQILLLGTPKPGRCKNLPALDLFPSSFSPALGHLWLVLKGHITMMVCVSCLLGFPAPVHLENQVFLCLAFCEIPGNQAPFQLPDELPLPIQIQNPC